MFNFVALAAVHTTPVKFETGVCTLKNAISLHTKSEKFKNATITGHDFGFVFDEDSS